MVLAAAATAALPLIAGGLNYVGQRDANRANLNASREQMNFQRESNREQMAFQERMSNTAYQRSMQDMAAAGLNPILAYSQGGASTPSGSSSAGSMTTHKSNFGSAVSSALMAKQVQAELEQTKVATELMRAELPEKAANAHLYSGKHGSLLKFIEKIFPTVSSAARMVTGFRK